MCSGTGCVGNEEFVGVKVSFVLAGARQNLSRISARHLIRVRQINLMTLLVLPRIERRQLYILETTNHYLQHHQHPQHNL